MKFFFSLVLAAIYLGIYLGVSARPSKAFYISISEVSQLTWRSKAVVEIFQKTYGVPKNYLITQAVEKCRSVVAEQYPLQLCINDQADLMILNGHRPFLESLRSFRQ